MDLGLFRFRIISFETTDYFRWPSTMNLNIDFDLSDLFIDTEAGEMEVEDILARQEEARSALEDQMRKAQAMLSVLVKKRDEQMLMYRDVVAKSQVLGEEVARGLSDERNILDAEIQEVELLRIHIHQDSQLHGGIPKGERKEFKEAPSSHQTIENGETDLNDLIARRATLDLQLGRIRDSPFQRLPPEIIQQIFLHCNFSNGSRKGTAESFTAGYEYAFLHPSNDKAPLQLTRVCKAWRALAFSLPDLWSSISIRVSEDGSSGFKAKPPLPVLGEWITRSGSRPLNFHICEIRVESGDAWAFTPSIPPTERPSSSDRQRFFQKIMRVFTPHYARWEAARFKFRVEGDFGGVFEDLPEGASYPLLRDLLIDRGSWEPQTCPIDVERMSNMLRNSPRLDSLRWNSQRFSAFASCIHWDYLKILQLESLMSMQRFRQVLVEASQLRSLSVRVFFAFPASPTAPEDDVLPPHLFLPHMRELAIFYEGRPRHVKHFLASVTIPQLQSFTLSGETLGVSPHLWPHAEFLELVQRSGCKLEFLVMHNLAFANETEGIEVLETLSSSLRHLAIQCDRKYDFVTDGLLKALEIPYPKFDPGWHHHDLSSSPPAQSPKSPTTIICPLLEYISLWNCLSSTDGVLSDMVASRRRVLRPLGVSNLGSVILTLNGVDRHRMDIEIFDALNEGQWGITYITV